MRCKCGSELSERAMARGGDYSCDECYVASEEVLAEATYLSEVVVPNSVPVDHQRLFSQLVRKHDLLSRWAEGLDEDRVYLMKAMNKEQECYDEFLALMEGGLMPQIAAETALGIIPTPAR